MTLRIAINGFGRIGRTILRQCLTRGANADIEVMLLNDIAPLETAAYLFQFDSVFGPFAGRVAGEDGFLKVDNRTIPFHNLADIASLDLSEIDVLLECTGKADTRDFAERGLQAGAKAVLISGPSAAADVTAVLGANEGAIGDAKIVSNASCTTNALAPVLKLLDERFGITHGHMTTVHCYTGSQPMVDAPRGDLARSRAGALSMVPTTTSATRLIGDVLPEIATRVTGAAVRVPVASVSAVDLTVTLERTGDVNAMLREAAGEVIGITEHPNVSTDLRSRPESLIVALPETKTTGNQARIFGWYDNEWGFSARMLDMARLMAARP